MTVSPTRVERWGVRFPFCPDWSCGTAAADDIRLVLKYTIDTPAGLDAPIEPGECPGKLLPTRTEDQDAPTQVTNAYANPLTVPVEPGTSATGTVEYSIKRDAQSHPFTIQSTCGDPDRDEIATFRGRLPDPIKVKAPGDIGDPPITESYLKLRVDQVRTDMGKNRYAALVEACVHRNLPDANRIEQTLRPSWSLVTSSGSIDPIKRWTTLRPVFPYGDYAKNRCMSGWLGFKLGAAEQVRAIHYTDRLGQSATWYLVKPTRPTASPTTAPPTTTPPTTRPTTTPPTIKPPTAKPTIKPPPKSPSSIPPRPGDGRVSDSPTPGAGNS